MTDTLEEKIKRYWNNQPCNIKHGQSEPGSLDFFQQVSARRHRVEPHIAEFAGFHLWAGKRVLEIGPGIGSDAAEFARNGAEYYAIDYSEDVITADVRRFYKDDGQQLVRKGLLRIDMNVYFLDVLSIQQMWWSHYQVESIDRAGAEYLPVASIQLCRKSA